MTQAKCPRCEWRNCTRCDHSDVTKPRNYGRVHPNETRLWCLCCGCLWEPNEMEGAA